MRPCSAERTASPSTFQRAHAYCGLTAWETGERNQSSSSSSTWFFLAGRDWFELMLIVSISRLLQDRLCPTEAYLTTFICEVSLFCSCNQHFSSNAWSQSNKWFPNSSWQQHDTSLLSLLRTNSTASPRDEISCTVKYKWESKGGIAWQSSPNSHRMESRQHRSPAISSKGCTSQHWPFPRCIHYILFLLKTSGTLRTAAGRLPLLLQDAVLM